MMATLNNDKCHKKSILINIFLIKCGGLLESCNTCTYPKLLQSSTLKRKKNFRNFYREIYLNFCMYTLGFIILQAIRKLEVFKNTKTDKCMTLLKLVVVRLNVGNV